MGKIKKKARLLVQLVFAGLTNGYAAGFLKGKIYTGKLKHLCVPGLNCYSCPGALGSCPIGSLQAVLGSRNYTVSFWIFGFFLIVGALLGRLVCGWLCPFGLVQDLIHRIPFPFRRKNLPGHRRLVWARYVVLAVFVVLLPVTATDFLGQGKPWFCQYICPSGTLFGGIFLVSLNEALRQAAGFLFRWKVLLLFLFLAASLVWYRPFCKYVCPLGAVYSVFQPIAFYHYELNAEKCTSCKACQKACGMDIEVWKNPNHWECIRCGACVKSCPHGALQSRWKRR